MTLSKILDISLHLQKLTIYDSFLLSPFLPFDTEERLVMFQSCFLSSNCFLVILFQTWSNIILIKIVRKCQCFYPMLQQNLEVIGYPIKKHSLH